MTPSGTAPVPASATREPASRLPVRLLALLLVGGLVVGAVGGLLLASSAPRTFTASAVVSVAPPAEILDGAPETDDSTALVQSELIILSGPDLRRDIQAEAGFDEQVDFGAAQVGTSTIVDVDATQTSRERALAAAEAVITAYSANRSQRLRTEVERAARVVDSELARLETEIASETIGVAALQQEYGRLLAVRSGLFRAAANADQAVTVVQPPVLVSDGLPPRARYGALGALAGALLGTGLALLLRQRRPSVRTSDDLVDIGVAVLQPEVVSHSGHIHEYSGGGRAAAAMRLLLSQVVRPDHGVLVLFGATPDVGTSFTAAAAAVCLSERSPVLLVLAADVVEDRDGTGALDLAVDGAPRGLSTLPARRLTAEDVLACAVPSSHPGVSVLARGPGASDAAGLSRLVRHGLLEACLDTGHTVIVDAPALCDATTSIDLADAAGSAVLVVGRGVTTRSEIETVRQAFVRQGIVLVGAIVNRPTRTYGHMLPIEPGSNRVADYDTRQLPLTGPGRDPLDPVPPATAQRPERSGAAGRDGSPAVPEAAPDRLPAGPAEAPVTTSAHPPVLVPTAPLPAAAVPVTPGPPRPPDLTSPQPAVPMAPTWTSPPAPASATATRGAGAPAASAEPAPPATAADLGPGPVTSAVVAPGVAEQSSTRPAADVRPAGATPPGSRPLVSAGDPDEPAPSFEDDPLGAPAVWLATGEPGRDGPAGVEPGPAPTGQGVGWPGRHRRSEDAGSGWPWEDSARTTPIPPPGP